MLFNQNFKSKYGAEPTDFVYKGYDTTYDSLIRMANYKNVNDAFRKGKTKGMSCNYNYNKLNSFVSPVNEDVFIIKYDNFLEKRVK